MMILPLSPYVCENLNTDCLYCLLTIVRQLKVKMKSLFEITIMIGIKVELKEGIDDDFLIYLSSKFDILLVIR